MDKLEKIRVLVEEILRKNKDYLTEEGFMVNDYAGGNIDDAFEIGLEQGYYDMAFSVKAILEGEENEPERNDETA